jgi:uncharacterized protein
MVIEALVVVLAIGVGAFMKGVTGFGLPPVAIPVMAAFLGPEHAVIIMAIPGLGSNVWQLWSHRSARQECPGLPSMVAATVIGAVIGTVLLKTLDSALLTLLMAVLIVVYIAVLTLRPGFAFSSRVPRFASVPVGLLAGGLQGSTGISSPLLSTYLHGLRLRSEAYVFALSAVFLVAAVMQVSTLTVIGAYDWALLGQSLLAFVPIAVFLPLGARARHRMSSVTFQRIVLVLLGLVAVKLVLDVAGVL